jgi:hypothetical protein
VAAADLTTPPNPKELVTKTTDDVVHFVSVLCEWLVPLVGGIIGLFLGPRIFSGTSIGDALWTNGFQSVNSSTQGSNAALVGYLVGSAVVGTAAASLWSYQEGRKGWASLISRAVAGFTIGWAIGILIGGLNAYFITGNTSLNQPFNSWLDGFVIQQMTVATSSTGATPIATGTPQAVA